MKTRLQTILNANLNPLFSALPCALLLAALGQATLLATQLDEAEDDIEAMFREPFPNHLWLARRVALAQGRQKERARKGRKTAG